MIAAFTFFRSTHRLSIIDEDAGRALRTGAATSIMNNAASRFAIAQAINAHRIAENKMAAGAIGPRRPLPSEKESATAARNSWLNADFDYRDVASPCP